LNSRPFRHPPTCIGPRPITTEAGFKLVTEDFDRRQIANISKAQDEAFAAEAQKEKGKKREVEYFNRHKRDQVKAECWAKGGGKDNPHQIHLGVSLLVQQRGGFVDITIDDNMFYQGVYCTFGRTCCHQWSVRNRP